MFTNKIFVFLCLELEEYPFIFKLFSRRHAGTAQTEDAFVWAKKEAW